MDKSGRLEAVTHILSESEHFMVPLRMREFNKQNEYDKTIYGYEVSSTLF